MHPNDSGALARITSCLTADLAVLICYFLRIHRLSSSCPGPMECYGEGVAMHLAGNIYYCTEEHCLSTRRPIVQMNVEQSIAQLLHAVYPERGM